MNLTISIIQTSLHWENPTANMAMLEEKITAIAHTDLIVLPETFNSGFTMNPASVAEPMNFTTFKWLKMMAQKTGAVITGSYAVKENGFFMNRLVMMQPSGEYATYDKRHLYRMGGEDKVYKAGQKKLIVNVKGFNICPLICYDIRFPVWARNVDLEYDILLYTANWPGFKRNVWNTLLQARAIENQAFVIGANIVGTDGNGLSYCGDSAIIDFKGDILKNNYNEDTIITHTIEKQSLLDFREKFPAYLDADRFSISHLTSNSAARATLNSESYR